jgi:hypothetical protein
MVVMSVSEDVLLSLLQNIERKKKAFGGQSIVEGMEKQRQKGRSLSLRARRPAPFVRIQEVTWP